MANLNIRNLSEGQREQIRVKAAHTGKSMESFARDLALETHYYELRVERGGDREFVPFREIAFEREAYAAWDEWRKDEHVTKLWLKVDGEFDLVWPCPRHDPQLESIMRDGSKTGEQSRCKRCREILSSVERVDLDD